MRIGIDVRCFAQGKNTGVEEYTKKALKAIFQADDKNEYVLLFNAWRENKVDFSWTKQYKNVAIKKYAIPNKLLNLSLWFLNYPKLDKMCGGVDIFFMPNNNFYALSQKTKVLVTVHDLSFEHYKNSFSLKRKIWHFFVNPRVLIKRAYHIFAVSEATKNDICQTYNIDSQKISIAKNGHTAITSKLNRNSIDLVNVKEKYNLPYKFVLYFGTIEPRKNIINIINAYDILRARNQKIKYKLVIVGAQGWKSKQIYYAADNSEYSQDIIFITDVPQEEKELLYKLASIFIYPSFFEGFGFPPLEAIACDVPTIVSHRTSLPEVVGDNAIMIDPMRIDEMALAMNEIIVNKKLQQILLRQASAHIKRFRWSIFANIFLKKIT